MNAYEIEIIIDKNGEVIIPENILDKLPKDKILKAIIMIPDYNEYENRQWGKLTVNEFLSGYNEEDSIYDEI